MIKRSFTVTALWDDEAQVYYSESDIIGLHIEAKTLDEFEAVMNEVARDLIVENHLKQEIVKSISLVDLIPTILWRRPQGHHAAA